MYAPVEPQSPFDQPFADIYKTHYRRIFSLCRYLLNSFEAAEDAAHEVFLRAQRKLATNSLLSVLALLTVFSSSSYGLDVRQGAGGRVTVPEGETIDDTLVAFGDSVIVSGTITGDLIAFARQVTVRGRVKGNMVSFARSVELEGGTVEGSVMGFGQSVQTRGEVTHNVYAFGQNVEVGRGARVGENAMMFGAESNIEGAVGKDVFTAAGSVNVQPEARIGGSLTARVGDPANSRVAPGATIGGATDIQARAPRPSRYATISFYVWQTIWLAGAFLTGLLLFWLAPALSRISFESTRELLLSAGAGFLALVATPVAALIAAITLIGLPIALIAFFSWILALYLAKIVVAGFLGRSLLMKGGDARPATALALLAGLVPIFVAVNLPYVGTLINFLLIVLGMGMLVIRTYQMVPRRAAA